MNVRLTHQRLKEVLDYNQSTGDFFLKISTNRRIVIGAIAGSKRSDGYVYISIDGNRFGAHRLAWFFLTGELPSFDIDHIDHNTSNNAFQNLRHVTRIVNLQNRINKATNNAKGLLGAVFNKKRNKFVANIIVDGKRKYLGQFDSEYDAHICYVNAKRIFHKGCTL